MCFKGGTLLRACWQHDYRFSEDLDFDWLDSEAANKDAIYNFFARVTSRASKQFGGEYSVRWGAHNMRLDWVFDGQSGAIKVDIKFRGQSQTEPTYQEWEIIGRYPRVPTPHKILGYSLESVMAAKLACIVVPDRKASRDCYDLYRLMNATGINRDAVLEEFVEWLRLSDSSFRVGDDWQSLVFDSVDAKLPYLEDDWATMTTNEMISGRAPRFNDMILNILDEVTAMPTSPRIVTAEDAMSSARPLAATDDDTTLEEPPEDLESLEETLAILTEPGALEAIAQAEREVADGDVIRGVEALKALRPQ